MLKKFMPPKRKAIFDFVADYIKRNGFAPTQHEVAGALGFTRSNVKYHFEVLEDQKLIRTRGRKYRNVELSG